MDNARQIAEERFARGEISEDEFKKIVSVLGEGKAAGLHEKQMNKNIPQEDIGSVNFMNSWQYNAIGALALFAMLIYITENFNWSTMPPVGKFLVAAIALLSVFSLIMSVVAYRKSHSR